MQIDLDSEFTLANCFRYPLQCRQAKREIVIGGLWVLVPFVGWILNMGHRIQMVHNMQHGRAAWPAWVNYPTLLRNGVFTFLGMAYYYLPGIVVVVLAWRWRSVPLLLLGGALLVAATLAIPGYMSHYCTNFDVQEIFNPLRALRRALEGGALYWKAWGIALSALAMSFLGLLALGVGFAFTSVWFWQVAGFSFARVFTSRFHLGEKANVAVSQ